MLELLLGRPNGKSGSTYENFAAALIAAKITEKTVNDSVSNSAGYLKLYPGPTTYSLWGSPYGAEFTTDSGLGNVALHAFPTLELFEYSRVNKLYCAFKAQDGANYATFTGITRNGYTSQSYTNYSGVRIKDFIYYDPNQKKMMRWNPYLKNTPEPWDGLLNR